MVSINSFNKNGIRLVAKSIKQPVMQEVIHFLEPYGAIPKNVKSFDYSSIERQFGKERLNIYSFKDEAGRLVKRFTISNLDNIYSVSDYSYSGGNARKIERKFYQNGKLIKEQFDNIFTTIKNVLSKKIDVSKTSLTRKFINDKNIKAEEQSLYGSFSNYAKPRKFIAKTCRLDDNSIKTKGFQYTGITLAEAKELSKDPYLGMRLLPKDDFLSTLRHKVYSDHELQDADIKTFKGSIDSIAKAERKEDGLIRIVLDKQKCVSNSRPEIVDSFNHEAQHCRQYIYTEQLDYTNNKIPSFNSQIAQRQLKYGVLTDPKVKTYSEQMKAALLNYTQPTNNFGAYYNNPTEIDARNAGTQAKNKYISFAQQLLSKIQLTSEQLGLS